MRAGAILADYVRAADPRVAVLGETSVLASWPHFADMALFMGQAAPERPAGARPRD